MSNEKEVKVDDAVENGDNNMEVVVKRVTYETARKSMEEVRIRANEIDSGLINVNRSNPALARDLKRKMKLMRDAMEEVATFLNQNGGNTEEPNVAAATVANNSNDSDNEGEANEQESSSENASEKTQGTTGGSNSPKLQLNKNKT